MIHRIFNVAICCAAFVLATSFAGAQSLSDSPYSTFGLGDPDQTTYAAMAGMGHARVALLSSTNVNPSNPATLAALSQPVFDVGYRGVRLGVTSQGSTATTSYGYLKNIVFAFPGSKRWKSSFALTPYTRLGYELSTTEENDVLGTVNYQYSGTGSINKVTWSNSYTLVRDSLNVLAVGANAHYLFGQLERTRLLEPSASSAGFDIQNTLTTNITGFDVDFGAFYLRKFGRNRIIGGITYGLGNQVNATQTEYTFSLSGGTQTFVKDSIEVVADQESKVKLPSSFGVGLTYEYGTKWTVTAEYRATNWSELNLNDSKLLDANQVAFGMQYVPNSKDITNPLNYMRYRAGFRYGNTRLQTTNGTQLQEYGITFGVGYPLIKSASRTNINVAFEVGQRGEEAPDAIREQFSAVTVGVTFAPNKFDNWFVKRRID